tara:strand:- start:5369 stop:6046 length:678 start_codon:yes stop_codon:yes gene_type:complete
MPRESKKALKNRALAIYSNLLAEFPDATCELIHSNALELLIATILSAQCTDAMVNRVTPQLFKKYPNAEAYASVKHEELEQDIKRIGLYRSKAKNIIKCCRTLVEKHDSQVPAKMEDLIELGGVGRKTANVVLGNIFNINEGVVVDTHVRRISQLLGIAKNKTPEKIEPELMKLFPQDDWTMLSHLLILHGRKTCVARRPRCNSCTIITYCNFGKKINQNTARQF